MTFIASGRQSLRLYLHESIYISARIQKFFHDASVAALARDEECGTAVNRGKIHLGSSFEKNFCDVDKAALGREEKRSRSSLLTNRKVRNSTSDASYNYAPLVLHLRQRPAPAAPTHNPCDRQQMRVSAAWYCPSKEIKICCWMLHKTLP